MPAPAKTLGDAVKLINDHRFGNGTALFTADGGQKYGG